MGRINQITAEQAIVLAEQKAKSCSVRHDASEAAERVAEAKRLLACGDRLGAFNNVAVSLLWSVGQQHKDYKTVAAARTEAYAAKRH